MVPGGTVFADWESCWGWYVQAFHGVLSAHNPPPCKSPNPIYASPQKSYSLPTQPASPTKNSLRIPLEPREPRLFCARPSVYVQECRRQIAPRRRLGPRRNHTTHPWGDVEGEHSTAPWGRSVAM